MFNSKDPFVELLTSHRNIYKGLNSGVQKGSFRLKKVTGAQEM